MNVVKWGEKFHSFNLLVVLRDGNHKTFLFVLEYPFLPGRPMRQKAYSLVCNCTILLMCNSFWDGNNLLQQKGITDCTIFLLSTYATEIGKKEMDSTQSIRRGYQYNIYLHTYILSSKPVGRKFLSTRYLATHMSI